MTNAKDKALNNAIALLRAAEATFSVRLSDGTIVGDLVDQVLEEQRTALESAKSAKKHVWTHRGITDYSWDMVKDLNAGESKYVPKGDYPAKALQKALTSRASAIWGLKSYQSMSDENGVLIVRF